jgi:hypothetical protein
MASTNQTSNPGDGGPGAAPARPGLRARILHGNRLHKVLIVILAVGLLSLYVWHLVTTSQVRSQLEAHMAASEERYTRSLTDQAATSLRLTGHALGWAAASDLGEANLGAIDGHITRMVRVGPVTVIAVADQEGTVRVSTNKKLEGQRAAAVFPGLPLEAEDVGVVDRDGEMVLVAPMIENGNRLGVAVLVYDRSGRGAARDATAGAEEAPAPGR